MHGKWICVYNAALKIITLWSDITLFLRRRRCGAHASAKITLYFGWSCWLLLVWVCVCVFHARRLVVLRASKMKPQGPFHFPILKWIVWASAPADGVCCCYSNLDESCCMITLVRKNCCCLQLSCGPFAAKIYGPSERADQLDPNRNIALLRGG